MILQRLGQPGRWFLIMGLLSYFYLFILLNKKAGYRAAILVVISPVLTFDF